MKKITVNSVVKVVKKEHKLFGYIGDVIRMIDVCGEPYCVIALDKGYQDDAVTYECIKYTAVVPLDALEIQNDNVGRVMIRRVCTECGKNCFSNKTDSIPAAKIGYEISGITVCENCMSKYYVDSSLGVLRKEKVHTRRPRRTAGKIAADAAATA